MCIEAFALVLEPKHKEKGRYKRIGLYREYVLERGWTLVFLEQSAGIR
jgi:hypothetical protein